MAKKVQSKGKVRDASVRSGRRRSTRRSLVLERRNYVLIAVGVALIAVGFVLMRVDNQVESFISLYLSPLIIIAGYTEIAYAIMWKPKKQATTEGSVPTKAGSRKSA